MKKIFSILAVIAMILGCTEIIVISPEPTPSFTGAPTATPDYSGDARLSMVSAESTEWIAYPGGQIAGGAVSRKINEKADVIAKCNKSKWSYIFFDDEAVIGYEPPADDLDGSIMKAAIDGYIETHNRDNPDAQWASISVPPPPQPTPNVSNDPILGYHQVAFCTDDGNIVWGPLTAEEDFNWVIWRTGGLANDFEIYNRDNDPDAHIVWGTE